MYDTTPITAAYWTAQERAAERQCFARRIRDVIESLKHAAHELDCNSNGEAGYVAEKARTLSHLAKELINFELSLRS